MTPLVAVAAVLAGCAVAVAAVPRGAGAAARLQALALTPAPVAPPALRRLGAARPGVLRAVAAALAAAGVAALVPPPAGPVLAVAAGAAAARALARLPGPDPGVGRVVEPAHVPPALDLLAACLTAGAALPEALLVVSEVTPRPLGPALAEAATALRLGAPPEQALAGARGQRELDRLADVLTQAASGGTAPAAAVARLAQEARKRAADSVRAAARRAGVLVVLPLGLCFLPAFVLLGVVPVVAGIAGRLLP